jgi:hypothetical protein
MMIENGRVTVISVDDPSVHTVDGVSVGMTEMNLGRMFGKRAVFGPRPYFGDAKDAHEVVVRLFGKRELVFETQEGRIQSIRLGGRPSTEYWEGCV